MNIPFKNIFPVKSIKSTDIIQYDFLPVPVHLFIEKRPNSRISLLKNKIHIRIPFYLPKKERQAELKKLLDWAQLHILKKGMYPPEQLLRDYQKDNEITIAGTTWRLLFNNDPSAEKMRVKADKSEFLLHFYGNFDGYDKIQLQPVIRDLIVSIFRSVYKEYMIKHVSSINDNTFKFSYKNVQLKYMKSRWGSCSSKRNINLSLRLLLLPDEARDYIIIHELAHLEEMNHSKRFWNLVARHVPDYKTIEKWLKSNGHLYDF